MKLNLLPTTEKKSRAGKFAILLAAGIVLFSIFAYGALLFFTKQQLEAAKSGIEDLQRDVANAKATSDSAETIVATAAPVIRNAQLAQAMIDHNDVFPKLYDDAKKYIPPYYRIQSMTATPVSATQSQLVLVGTLTGYQHYADLMLALMRFKDAVTITRLGYNLNDPTVPALSVEDQIGKMRKGDVPPIPDDGLERLAYFQSQAAAVPKGYLATGSYGTGSTDVRGPLPNASLVTIQMLVNRNLQVPLASATLGSGGGGAAAPAAFGGGRPGGPPAGIGGGGGGRGD